MNRADRAQIAQETLAILKQGGYTSPSGQSVDLTRTIQHCLDSTVYFGPDTFDKTSIDSGSARVDSGITVANETTLAGAFRLASSGKYNRIGVLNFASAKRPGGGFLNGSAAQEESLARSSALYASLQQHPAFYSEHRRMKNNGYSDRMIHSPGCPIFRNDDGVLLDSAYVVDFITCAAPNAGAMGKSRRSQLPAILHRRVGKILALGAFKGCDALLLGAWGCGVFRNDPVLVAATFGEYLMNGGPYAGQFEHVRFSVLDDTVKQSNFAPFAAFQENNPA